MFSVQTRLLCRKLNIKYLIQCSSSNSPTDFPEITIQTKFSNTEQEKILNILNEADNTQLLCLNVGPTKIKNFENYKKKKGSFKTLDELLEVDGVSVKMLEKLCKQLITETPTENVKPANENKKIKQLLTPSLPANIAHSLNSAVGIHLTPMGVSWAKLVKSKNQLESWGCQDFSNLPKKLCPVDTFHLGMTILGKIPKGDIYIFEGANSVALQGQKQSTAVTSYNLHLELSSMLLALINTSKDHNTNFQDDSTKYETLLNCVYFLKPKLAARLFNTLVGNECVSNTATILHLLGDSTIPDFAMPCSPIIVGKQLKNDYLILSSSHKELLGQALMLIIAFTDLCVNRNPVSIKTLMPGKK